MSAGACEKEGWNYKRELKYMQRREDLWFGNNGLLD